MRARVAPPPRGRPASRGGFRRARALGTCLAVALLAFPASAAPTATEVPRFAIRRFGLDEGLPQNTVNAVLHGRDGYLWVGTNGGLVRFDGVRFFPVPCRGADTPPLARVQRLLEDSGGTMWVGTEGSGLLVVRDGALVRPRGLVLAAEDTVEALLEVRPGRLLVGLSGRGLVAVEGGRETEIPVDEDDGRPGILALARTSDGRVTALAGRRIYRLAGDRLVTVPVTPPLGLVAGIALAEGTGLLLGFWSGGIAKLEETHLSPVVVPSGPPAHGASALARDGLGRTWALVAAEGLFLVDGSRARKVPVPAVVTSAPRTLSADREGNLWVGTLDQGLLRLRPAAFHVFGRDDGLPEQAVRGVCEDASGALWVAVGCTGLVRLRPGPPVVVGPAQGLGDACVFSVWPARDGSVWATGYNEDVYAVSGGRARAQADLRSRLPVSVYEDRAGAVWVGTRSGGLLRRRDGVVRRLTRVDGLPSDEVLCFAEDAAGRLLAGTGTGVAVLDGDRVSALAATGDPMPRKVRMLLPDGDDVWVGSYGDGLSLLRRGRLFRFGRAHGLLEEVVSWIHDDGAGWLWLTGNHGIYRASKAALLAIADGHGDGLEVFAYGTADGLEAAETNGGFQAAGWRSVRGEILVPTVRGLAAIDPRVVSSAAGRPPPVRIVEALVEGSVVGLGGGPLTVPAGARRLEVRYTALSFAAPERIRFRTRLEGLDGAWVRAGERRSAEFTGLRPGRYRFEVQSSREGGGFTGEPARLAFSVAPRFVETRLFHTLVVLGAVALAAGATALRTAALRRRNLLLASLVEQRTRELADANRRLDELARTDDLTGLGNHRAFTERLLDEWQQAARQGDPLALLMVDVDRFKLYNDALGHLSGDVCLRRVAGLLSASAREPADFPARYGGEEFTVLLPRTDGPAAVAIARRMRERVEDEGIPHPASPEGPVVTVSIGVACLRPSAGAEPSSLIAAADVALYEAKAAGRNRVSWQPSALAPEGEASRIA